MTSGWQDEALSARRPRGLGGSVACALAAALLPACAGCVQPVSEEARRLLVASRTAYDRGDDAAAIRDADAFLAQHEKSELADVAYYLRGLSRYRRKDPAGAKADLKLAAARTQRKDVRVGSLKALGDLAFEEGDAAWAATLYRHALEEVDQRAKPTDEILYRLGCALQHQGRWGEADEQFDRVVHVFAGSELSRRAERRLRCQAWTVQAAAFTRNDLAQSEASRLRAAGLAAQARPLVVDGQLQYVVQVGRHDTYDQANASLPSVRRHRGDAFVIPTR